MKLASALLALTRLLPAIHAQEMSVDKVTSEEVRQVPTAGVVELCDRLQDFEGNSSTVFNVAQFYDGRAEDLKTEAKGPMQPPVEMASEQPLVVAILKSMPEYLKRFKQAFPNDPDAITFNNVAMAILLSLVAAGYWKWSGSKHLP